MSPRCRIETGPGSIFVIEDGEEFFKSHPDQETRKRGLFLVQVIDGLRDAIQQQAIKRPETKLVTLKDFERQFIAETMEEFGGNVSRSAIALGISRASLYDRLEKLAIKYDKYERKPK